ncbi:MAG: hypothetical protein HWN67_07325 [Candidatus Helarchaeota archaeon]|nr:hypothetical protein [Candidatus Helarchaeota archaeon]
MSVDEEKYQKNIEIIKKYMLEEIKLALKNSGKFIMDNMPTYEAAYQLLVGPDEEERSRRQINLILECAAKLKSDHSNFEELIESNFKQYLRNDNLGYNMRKRHRKSVVAFELIKEMFKNHVISFSELLRGEGETYDDLSRSVSPTYEEAIEYVNKEIEISNKISDLIRNDRGIINAPGYFRYDIMLAVLNLIEYGNKRLIEETKRIYNK